MDSSPQLEAQTKQDSKDSSELGDPINDGGLENQDVSQQNEEDVAAAVGSVVLGAAPISPPDQGAVAASDASHSVLAEPEKKFLLLTASFAAAISPFSSSIYYPSVNVLSRDLSVSITLINLTITTYLIFQGLAPSFTAAVSETYGRRPAYLACFVVYLGANIGLALQDNYAALLVLRCLQSCGSSGTIALSSAVVSDLATRAERGKYVAYATMGSSLGPALGPVVGGLLSQFLGWRAIFWFLTIFCGVSGSVVALFFRETSRSIVGNGSIPPARWNRSVYQVIRQDLCHKPLPPADVATLEKRKARVNPLTSVKILLDKENFLIIAYTSLVWAGYLSVVSILSSQLERRYAFNEIQIGLCYLPLGLGSLSTRWTTGFVVDWNFRRLAKRHGLPIVKNRQQDISRFDVEAARLGISLPMMLGSCCCILAYGWTMEFRTPLAAVLVVLFFLANITTGSFVAVSALIVDINRERVASAAAAGNLVRCLIGAGAVAVATPLIDAIGIGWTSSLTAFLWLAFSPCLILVYRRGHQWRMDKAAKRGRKGEKGEKAGEKQ